MSNLPREDSNACPTSKLPKSSNSPRPTRALLSIRPEYVEKIVAGTKSFELRRVIFAPTVSTVVVYVTAPIKHVVGEFATGRVLSLPPEALWEEVKAGAGVNRERFMTYFAGCQVGHAIEIRSFTKYPAPLPISDFSVRPPQSFVYLRKGSGHR